MIAYVAVSSLKFLVMDDMGSDLKLDGEIGTSAADETTHFQKKIKLARSTTSSTDDRKPETYLSR